MLCYTYFLKTNLLINLKYLFNLIFFSLWDLCFLNNSFNNSYVKTTILSRSYQIFWTHSSAYDSLILSVFDNLTFIVLNSISVFSLMSPIESFTFFVSGVFLGFLSLSDVSSLWDFVYGFFFFISFFLSIYLLVIFLFL